MHQLSLSWGLDVGPNCRGGNQRDPQWTDIAPLLESLKSRSGTVGLDILNAETGPQTLQVASEHGMYLLTLGEINQDGYNVRDYTNPRASAGQTMIHEYLWSSQMLCWDFDIVMQVFKQFFDTGDVSRDILD
jgi:hypothetical protein